MSDLKLYDTTLRDGAQTHRVNFSLRDKLEIAKLLSGLGFDYIEGGWPFSNRMDREFFRKVRGLNLKARVAAFGMTAKSSDAVEDKNLNVLAGSGADVLTIFGKSWDLHVTGVLRLGPGEYLDAIRESLRFLKQSGREVIYDAEHFFDGYKGNAVYAMKTLEAAAKHADVIVLCDTNGGCLPSEVFEITKRVSGEIEKPLGIHCHNDGGLALANTLAAIDAGAAHVQGTVNGLGERCGNLDLLELVPSLHKKGFGLSVDMGRLTEVSGMVERISGIRVPENKPYVGRYAFAHKGGVHSDASLKVRNSYEHIEPEFVGNKRWFPISEQSGRSILVAEARRYGFVLGKEDAAVKSLLAGVKKAGDVGDSQLYLLLNKKLAGGREPFEVLEREIIDRFAGKPKAFLKVMAKGKVFDEVSEGDGPVNAIDLALKKVLRGVYPEMDTIRLLDYRVTLPVAETGTEAWVIVFIEFGSNGEKWTSVARDTDIIRASERALMDGYKYYILRKPENR
jgi:2-isopropylmalate synthase